MLLLVFSFLVAFVVTLLAVRSAASHAHLSGDTDRDQPQKFHARVVPRIGGVGIVVGVLAGGVLAVYQQLEGWHLLLLLTGCGLVAFGAGLIEDFTKRVTPKQRLLATIAAAALAFWLADAVISRTGIPGLDTLMLVAGVPLALTLLAVAGVANSVNIIDGFNGLASMCVAIMLAALAYVAFQVGDFAIMNCALIGLGAVLGFFVWNYPLGLIFLGDGGAYFLGFWVAELGILLVQRNAEVSPVFPLLLCAYPIFETLFTMYRRRVIRGRPVGLPDATHLHSLIYRRLMRWAIGKHDAANLLRRNSMTSPYLWVLCSLSVLPAVLWWNDGRVLSGLLLAFCTAYLLIYRAIVHFRTPRFLLRKTDHWAVTPLVEH
ncbi:glycosyltransferase [Sphaerotilus sp.]|uniref:MraY family glycosyltransferase n=1 Tax=Sphaerotilus sp. TaxID=2093942 RepID=UPI002ACEC1D3|nr:glycosyltransferase [Sphaerotilus sp.]MDZ7857578.1 glycosyltransferase [Sphaerotilus sp.]